jgi:hypothetical protein
MFDIFENPYGLLFVAVLTLLTVLTVRSVLPEKRHWWQWLLPVLVAVAAFGLDRLVETDLEKITALINSGIKAVEEENIDAIDAIISENYRDSHHNTKEGLMHYCRITFSEPLIEKNKKRYLLIELSPDKTTANAALSTIINFDQRSEIYRNFKPALIIKMELHLQKELNKNWLIDRAEVIELDRQPVQWKQLK